MDPTSETAEVAKVEVFETTPTSNLFIGTKTPISNESPLPDENLEENGIYTYLNEFRKSSMYRRWYAKFYEGKTIPPDLSEGYKRQVFENNSAGNTALYEFSRNEPFIFFEEDYPPNVQGVIREYIRIATEHKRILRQPVDRQTLNEIDNLRSSIHNIVGDVFLDKGYVSTSEQGKLMAHLILVGSGIDQLAPPLPPNEVAKIAAYQAVS